MEVEDVHYAKGWEQPNWSVDGILESLNSSLPIALSLPEKASSLCVGR